MRQLSPVLAMTLIIGCATDSTEPTEDTQSDDQALQAAPANSNPVPGDYDGDGLTDIALRGSNGVWYIDLSSNGYGGRWDLAYWGYSGGVPAQADYDGDGKTDLAVHDGSTGMWYIDYSQNGFGTWDWSGGGYGNSSVAVAPGDYDGDHKADISILDSSGCWYIDYASDGFGSWNWISCGHGTGVTAVPADYDGDGKTDIAIKDGSASGCWYIDYASDGFNGWNWIGCGYGATSSGTVPVTIPGDYDRDGKYDIAEKDSSGHWYIDYASDGFGSWGSIYATNNAGNSGMPAIPGHYLPNETDLSVYNTSNGYWYVDYKVNGFNGIWDLSISNTGRQLYNVDLPYIYATQIYGAGDQFIGGTTSPNTAPTTTNLTIGVPYTIAVKIQPGAQINPRSPCTNGSCPTNYSCNTDENLCHVVEDVQINPDLAISPTLYINNPLGATYGAFDVHACSNDADCTAFYEPAQRDLGSGTPKYTCTPGNSCTSNVDCCTGTCNSGKCAATQPLCNTTTHVCNIYRYFRMTCSNPGNYAVGFQFQGAARSNPDYGIRINCTGNSKTGLYGVVTARMLDANKVYRAGAKISGATVKVGIQTATTLSDGSWSMPSITGSSLTVTVTAPGYSPAIAVNVAVPSGSSTEVDTSLEEPFTSLANAGISYTTYLDYSKGRTLLHVLKINPIGVKVSYADSPITSYKGYPNSPYYCTSIYVANLTATQSPIFDNLVNAANAVQNVSHNFMALINGLQWDTCTGNAIGYAYANGLYNSEVTCEGGNLLTYKSSSTNCTGGVQYYAEGGGLVWPANNMPLFTVNGAGVNQSFGMVPSEDNFWWSGSTGWNQLGSPLQPIWDTDRNGLSDVTYAFQSSNPPLLAGQTLIAGGPGWCFGAPACGYDYGVPRTAVGVGPGVGGHSAVYFVVSDGEGVQGGNGPTPNKLAHFFRDVLGATVATEMDSGLSSGMILNGASGPRRINTITGEDATIQGDPYGTSLTEAFFGSVANYVLVTY